MFINNATLGENKYWQYILTIFFVILGYVLGQVPLGIVIYAKMRNSETGLVNNAEIEAFAENMNFAEIGVSSNFGLVLLLLTFVGAFLALWAGIAWFHKRPLKTLITTKASINWSKIAFAFFVWLAMGMALEVVSYVLDPGNYTFQFKATDFLVLVLICLTILPIQTSFEELFFRGYLFQGIGNGARSPMLPIMITSLLFGVVHLMNPEISEFGLGIMFPYYVLVGVFLAVMTVMDDSLELALGIHAATNFYGAAFVTFKGSALQTDTLFRMNEVNIYLMLPMFLITAVIFLLICKQKYQWGSWQKLISPAKVEMDEMA